MARVIFINRFYFPDEQATAQLLTDLAEDLAAAGHEIAVIASLPNASPVSRDEIVRGVSVHRVRSTRWGRRHLPGRLVDFAGFYLGALRRLLRLARAGDAVVVMTDPPLLGAAAAPLVRWRGATPLHWVQDIYPEIAVDLTGHRWLLALRPLRNAAWRRARACIVPGSDMARLIEAAGVPSERIAVSPNWAPRGLAPASEADVAALREEWGLTGKFVIGYSGNLGRVHDLVPILDLAATLQGRSDFAVVFIGNGAQRPFLETQVRTRLLSNVHFRPAQPRQRLAVSLAVPDVHLVTLRPGGERCVFPSKLYGAAAAGRPVLFIGAKSSEIAAVVQQAGFGRSFTREEVPAMAVWLDALAADRSACSAMRKRARIFAQDGFAAATRVWHTLLATSPTPTEMPAPTPP